MINYLSNQEIDKIKWDNCIERSNNELIYAYSWYLDSIAPGWSALVLNDYEVVMPLPVVTKFFNTIYQPFFAQQLGIFNTQQMHEKTIVDFIQAIPAKFKYINVCLNENNVLNSDYYHITKRKNYVLYLHRDYTLLYKGFNEQNKRNVRKSFNSGLSINTVNTDAVVDFYSEQKSRTTLDVKPHHYNRFKLVLQEATKRDKCLAFQVTNSAGVVHASAAFYKQKGRIIFQIGTANAAGRESKAMFFLMNHVIKEYSNQNLILDFEGSEINSIARFFSGFGASHLPYYRLVINRLPWPIRWLKK